MIRRSVSVLAAVVMIVAALAVRGTFSDDAGGDGGEGGGVPDGLVVACPIELAGPCRETFGSDAVIEHAAATFETLTSGDGESEIDAWVVSRSWTDVLETAAPGQVESVTPIGVRTPIAFAMWSDRREQVLSASEQCDAVDLNCLGDLAGRSFDEIGLDFRERAKIGFSDLSTMTGLDVIAAAGTAYFDGNDFASNDFDDPDFRSFLADLLQDVDGTDNPLRSMLTEGPGRLTAVIGLRAVLEPQVAANTRQPVDLVDTRGFSELFVVDLAEGPDASRAAGDALRDAFVDEGWDPHELDPDAQVDDGLAVRPGVLAALHDLAHQAA